MKVIHQFAAAAATVFIIFIYGCTQLTALEVEPDILTYLIDSTDQNLSVNVTYIDGDNEIIKLSSQSLPWSLTIELSDGYTGDAYLKAIVPQDDVFVPFVNGSADTNTLNKLVDSGADFFASGVEVGDVLYSDNTSLQAAYVFAIDDQSTLSISLDLFPDGDEPYYIYHRKNLTASVELNGLIVKTAPVENEKALTAIVQTPLDR
jgi:hypothetical protein